MHPRIIAIANQKGGVGKTTTTVNLAYAFLSQGKRVLAIDLDPQASLSISLGLGPKQIKEIEAARHNYFALVKGRPLSEMIVEEAGRNRPDLVPASIRLAAAETELLNPLGSAHVLRERIEALPFSNPYDVILIDCPPTLGILTVNGLSAAGEVLIPAKTDLLSVMGVPLLLDTIENIRRRANPDLRILGVLPTLYHPRNTHDQEVLSELKSTMAAQGITVFEPVHHSTAFDKAVAEGRAALDLWPQTPGVQSYQRIVESNPAYGPKSKVSDRFPSRDVFFGTSADLPRIVELDVAKVVWNPDQPRKSIDAERLQELADSITTNGLIHPITVKRAGDDQYMIVAGERRFRAFALLERASIPVIISEGDTDELALIENVQREDLTPIDEFQAVARLMEKHGYSQSDAARVLGKSRVSINELMSLSGLAAPILDEAQQTRVSKSILIEIARADDESAQLKLWAAVRDGAKTVRALRATKKAPAEGSKEPSPIGTALRAGRRFASALAELPAGNERFAEIRSATERLVSLLDEAEP